MNTFKSLLASMATLLLISGTLANVHQKRRFMHNGKVYDDKFYELFFNKAPVQHIIKLAVSWDAEKQMEHFKQLYHHITTEDESAKYAQSVVDATRAVLARTLKEVGFEKEITLEQYLEGTIQIQQNKKSEVDPDVLAAIDLLDKIDNDAFEKILNEGAQEEVDWELENLRPYDMVPFDNSKSAPKPETEETPVVESQAPEESTPQRQEPTVESQEPQESTPEPQVLQESVPEKPTPAETVPQTPESVEEVIAEPSQLEDAVPEIQELKETVPQTLVSEETISDPQESKQES